MPSSEETNHSSPTHDEKQQEAYQGLAKSIAFHAGIKIAIIVAIRLVQRRMTKSVARKFNSNL